MITLTAIEGSVVSVMPEPRTARARTVPGAAVEALRIMRKRQAHGVIHVGGNTITWATVERWAGGSVGIVKQFDIRLPVKNRLVRRDEYTMHDLRQIDRRERRVQDAERRL